MRFLPILFWGLIAANVITGSHWLYESQRAARPVAVKQPIRPPKQFPEPASLSTILIQRDNKQDANRLLICRDSRCSTESIPHSVSNDALSDGESWYHYVDVEDEKNDTTKRVLQRTWIEDNRSDVIVEQTPLVKPRDLFISPDGQKVAYWLDNISDPKAELTELWMYDAAAGGTVLLAEKLYQPDILTIPRWNHSSSHLWFIADTSRPAEPDKIELLVVSTQPIGIAARFGKLDWKELRGLASSGTMDVSLTGTALAYAKSDSIQSQLSVVMEDGNGQGAAIPGNVPYLQWLEDGSLLYAIQDSRGFAFWRQRGSVHSLIARSPGTLRSAHSDVRGEYLAFAAQAGVRDITLHALHVSSGRVIDQGEIPAFGDHLKLVHVAQTPVSNTPAVAGASTFDDAELTAFIENNFTDIVGVAVKPIRIITTSQPNTLYVDFRIGDQETRILVAVKDVIHPEWSILGRYQVSAGEWQKVQGGGLEDPKPQRVYEWEGSVKQWILKSSL